MSENSNSTGSTGSSTNSWTLLSPEEVATENVGPVDDGTESLGDVPSLSEEVAGAAAEMKHGSIPVETVLSEEGHQVCQETSPDSSEGPVPSSPSRMSPLPPSPLDPPDFDMESQPPIIHDIVTSSPSDNEHLGAMPFVTGIDVAPLDIPAVEIIEVEPEESRSPPHITEIPIAAETPADSGLIPPNLTGEEQVYSAKPEINIPTETLTATLPSSQPEAEITSVPDSTEPPSPEPENVVTENPFDESPAPETIGSAEEEEGEEVLLEEETAKPSETEIHYERGDEEGFGEAGSFNDGLRRRNVPSFEVPRPRTSDEEDEEEEVEFKLDLKKEEKSWFSMSKCIVGVLVLLFLGSLFLSGDFDTSELSDGEQGQDGLSSDPQDMKGLLDKLTQENQQITQLEAQLQFQKEEIDSALSSVAANGDEMGRANLEKENMKLKEELSSLPELKKELESLRARVTELSKLTGDQGKLSAASAPASQSDDKDGYMDQKTAGPGKRKDSKSAGKLKDELQRQKVLLEESKKRLDGMKKHGGDGKRVRDSLEEIQRKLSEQVERWGAKKPQDSKWKGKPSEQDRYKKEKKSERGEAKEWKYDREENTEKRGEKEWKHEKEKERRGEKEWKNKEEKEKRGDKEWKHNKEEKERRGEKEWTGSKGGERRDREGKEWKPPKQNSHKEAWRKHQDEWERKKGERRMDREERRKEKPWHSQPRKDPQQPRQHHNDFWRDQEQKLQRNIRPQLGCSSLEDCAMKEGLYPVELSEFEELLEGYLSKLEKSSSSNKDRIRKLTTDFFEDDVFIHDRIRFSDFVEDVADILEDMVDVVEGNGLKDDDSLEEEMEEFEREALWKFSATA
ncbi:pre-B-cell leukemia transcription factor-interacting protein 1 [Pholidichthys leucotaenia]